MVVRPRLQGEAVCPQAVAELRAKRQVGSVQTTRLSLSLQRRLAYSLLAATLALGGIEVAAWALERLVPRPLPSLASPAPVPDPASLAPLLAEIARDRAARGLPPNVHAPIPMVDARPGGWALPPNLSSGDGPALYRTNAQGLRGPMLESLPAQALRLLTLGDSSVFGDGVREDAVFSSVAARALEQAWHRAIVAVIGAVPGHTSAQSLEVLEAIGVPVAPTWIVIANLWSDLYRADRHADPDSEHGLAPQMRSSLRRFALYRVLHRGISPWLESRQVRFLVSLEDVGSLENGPRGRIVLSRYIQNLRALAERSRALGARPIFLVLPAPMDLDGSPPPATVRAYRLAMKEVAAALEAPLVDGPAYFTRHGARLGEFRDQVHPSTEGHALLGAALAEELLAGGPPMASGHTP